ncbi:MAG: peptide/nickel transport system permease protein [Acidimicrobiaceae bacterium]|jgi:peptide/nickel transport system permease protein
MTIADDKPEAEVVEPSAVTAVSAASSDAELIAGIAEPEARSQWQLFRRRFVRHKMAVFALAVLLALYVIVIFAGTFAPYDPNPSPLPLKDANIAPNAQHWFGTDELGRDQLSRIIYAGRVSLAVGFFVAVISTVVGTAVGSIAGYFGRWIDQLLMRVTDLFLIIPGIALAAMAQKGLQDKEFPIIGKLSTTVLMVVILSFLFWQTIARVTRGLMLSVKEKEYVEAARASGASSRRIIVRHIIPNMVGPIVVNTTLVVGYAILAESTLSFLGFGIQLPDVSWGNMLNASESAVGTKTAYLIYFPGLLLLLTVLAVNFLGDGLRDAFDPQSGHSH